MTPRRRWTRRVLALAAVLACTAIAVGAPGNSDGDALAKEGIETSPEVMVIRHPVQQAGSGVLTLRNTSMMAMTVAAIEGTCDPGMAFVNPGLPRTVGAGSAQMLTFVCSSALATGMHRCEMTLKDTAGEALDQLVAICDTGTSQTLTATPSSHAFPDQPVGTSSAPFRFDVVKPGAGTPSTQLYLQLDDLDGNFLIGAPCQDEVDCAPGVTLGSGSNTPVSVVCKPTEAGLHTARLHVFTNDAFSAPPIELSCSGAPTSLPVYDRGPTEIQLGTAVGSTTRDDVRVTNVGSGSGVVNVTSATVQGADWSLASISGACTGTPCQLQQGQTAFFKVQFTPTTSGQRDGVLEIVHDSVTDPVPLRGIGSGATLELVGNADIQFGTVPVSTTSAQMFTLRNRGNVDAPASFTLSGDAAAFSVVASTNVPPGGTTPVTVSCGSATPGMYAATLQVTGAAPPVTSPAFSLTLTCEVANTTFYATPSAIALGEVRTGTSPPDVEIAIVGDGVVVESIALERPTRNLAVVATPGMAPLTATLQVTPVEDTLALDNALVITPAGTLAPLRIPISGAVTTAAYAVPAERTLGTFCVDLPTAPTSIGLQSTGTATLVVAAPMLEATDSELELDPVGLEMFPQTLAPLEIASIDVRPRRRSEPGDVADRLRWDTDAGAAETRLSATFIAEGAAVSPTVLDFQKVPIHLTVENAIQVHLQNCNATPIVLDQPTVPPPFALDSGAPPESLAPGETALFSIGFHPTTRGEYRELMQITSADLAMPLVVELLGEGVAGTGEPDPDGDSELTSFYACGCTTSSDPDPTGPLAIALAALWPTVRRRRRR